MTTRIERSALVSHSAEQMFDLIDAIELYPGQFGWCKGAEVILREPNRVVAKLDIGISAFKTWFKTENTLDRPKQISMHLLEGPFKSLEGIWHFKPLAENACKVTLELQFEPSSPLMAVGVKMGLQAMADQMVNDFVRAANRQTAT
ncbi:type II toxin-antitoxin system RatA family toxin [Lysobacter sp. HDW10]|uniref:type II toxin-antitoxin system RatA family toxin n=1 Tax=Lysobacter sp. HDW10 TaxID=2714936 RepID=UPI001409E39C|nr:type II toxin-antitoxin system RatA family toxin [Lysobacter sp. HDW10]QIK81744.1 type II toxin-antitoxin system RatA family toxin [Lysobacter sp. HDW10]